MASRDDLEPVAFIRVEDGDDLIVSFAITLVVESCRDLLKQTHAPLRGAVSATARPQPCGRVACLPRFDSDALCGCLVVRTGPRRGSLPFRSCVRDTRIRRPAAEELKTSRTYNEILRRAGMQDGLNVPAPRAGRLPHRLGPERSRRRGGLGVVPDHDGGAAAAPYPAVRPRPASAGGRRRSGRVARRPARHHRAGHHPVGRARADRGGEPTGPWPCCAPARAWSTRAGSWARPSRRMTPCCRAC